MAVSIVRIARACGVPVTNASVTHVAQPGMWAAYWHVVTGSPKTTTVGWDEDVRNHERNAITVAMSVPPGEKSPAICFRIGRGLNGNTAACVTHHINVAPRKWRSQYGTTSQETKNAIIRSPTMLLIMDQYIKYGDVVDLCREVGVRCKYTLVGTVKLQHTSKLSVDVIVRLPEHWEPAMDPRYWASETIRASWGMEYAETYRRARAEATPRGHGLHILGNNVSRTRRLTFQEDDTVFHPGAPCVHVTIQGKSSFKRGDTVANSSGDTGVYCGCTSDGKLIVAGIGEVEPGQATVQNDVEVAIEPQECETACRTAMMRRATEADSESERKSVNRKLDVDPMASDDIVAVPATPAESGANSNRRRPDSPSADRGPVTPSDRGASGKGRSAGKKDAKKHTQSNRPTSNKSNKSRFSPVVSGEESDVDDESPAATRSTPASNEDSTPDAKHKLRRSSRSRSNKSNKSRSSSVVSGEESETDDESLAATRSGPGAKRQRDVREEEGTPDEETNPRPKTTRTSKRIKKNKVQQQAAKSVEDARAITEGLVRMEAAERQAELAKLAAEQKKAADNHRKGITSAQTKHQAQNH